MPRRRRDFSFRSSYFVVSSSLAFVFLSFWFSVLGYSLVLSSLPAWIPSMKLEIPSMVVMQRVLSGSDLLSDNLRKPLTSPVLIRASCVGDMVSLSTSID